MADEKFIKSFQDIVREYALQSKDIKLLPLCHTTTIGYILNIIKSKGLKPKKTCPVYNEYLVYFFYGKSSYLVEKEIENYSQNPPITLIYDITKTEPHEIKRLLPFDSGGFDRYQMPEGFERDQFSFIYDDKTNKEPLHLDLIKGMIKLIYSNNEQYFKNQVDIDSLKKHVDECWEMQEMIELYTRAKKGGVHVAQQVHSFEIQYKEKLDAEPQYIILPYNFFMTKFWGENFRKQFPHIIIDHYGEQEIIKNPGQVLSGSEYMQLMKKKVMEIVND